MNIYLLAREARDYYEAIGMVVVAESEEQARALVLASESRLDDAPLLWPSCTSIGTGEGPARVVLEAIQSV